MPLRLLKIKGFLCHVAAWAALFLRLPGHHGNKNISQHIGKKLWVSAGLSLAAEVY